MTPHHHRNDDVGIVLVDELDGQVDGDVDEMGVQEVSKEIMGWKCLVQGLRAEQLDE